MLDPKRDLSRCMRNQGGAGPPGREDSGLNVRRRETVEQVQTRTVSRRISLARVCNREKWEG